jgi:hypothetical protein
MNILTQRLPWANWQFGLLKASMAAMGILLGASFPEFWRSILWLVWVVFVVTVVWVSALWLRAMKTAQAAAGNSA